MSRRAIAIVNSSAYVRQIEGMLVRNGFDIAHHATLDHLLASVQQPPDVVLYCSHDADVDMTAMSASLTQLRTPETTMLLVVSSQNLDLVRRWRDGRNSPMLIALYEPFEVDGLLNAVGAPNESDRARYQPQVPRDARRTE